MKNKLCFFCLFIVIIFVIISSFVSANHLGSDKGKDEGALSYYNKPNRYCYNPPCHASNVYSWIKPPEFRGVGKYGRYVSMFNMSGKVLQKSSPKVKIVRTFVNNTFLEMVESNFSYVDHNNKNITKTILEPKSLEDYYASSNVLAKHIFKSKEWRKKMYEENRQSKSIFFRGLSGRMCVSYGGGNYTKDENCSVGNSKRSLSKDANRRVNRAKLRELQKSNYNNVVWR